ncbi:uncharacterized protein LOC143300444 [Babylonia areolata]|uniref:uncharacterized protein LOC143300444 n=1 Tax=Babylonia areolata TaxID=304850 RepID=UPI003FCF6598
MDPERGHEFPKGNILGGQGGRYDVQGWSVVIKYTMSICSIVTVLVITIIFIYCFCCRGRDNRLAAYLRDRSRRDPPKSISTDVDLANPRPKAGAAGSSEDMEMVSMQNLNVRGEPSEFSSAASTSSVSRSEETQPGTPVVRKRPISPVLGEAEEATEVDRDPQT